MLKLNGAAFVLPLFVSLLWVEVMGRTKETVSPIVAGLTASCPRCGKDRLFSGILNLKECCTSCGLNYKFVDSGDGPAVFAIFILGFLVLAGALWLEFTFFPPLWVHVVLWGLVTPIIAVVLLRFLKSLLIALQFHHGAEEARLDE